jgi:hypothetical protein
MHDWTLTTIRFDWRSARVTLDLEAPTSNAAELVAEGVHSLRVPRENEWGPSVSVNEVSVESLSTGLRSLRVEMQSGDVIEIVAEHLSIPGADGTG